jgi:hypothetical protein
MWMLSKHHFMCGRLDWRPETLMGKTTVRVREKLEERRSSNIAATLSGARIESIALGAARAFLAQVGEKGEIAGSFVGAWGAFEHPEALIGVLARHLYETRTQHCRATNSVGQTQLAVSAPC